MLIHDDTGARASQDSAGRAQDIGERRDAVVALPWLFPWVLAFAGMLITLALMR